jgi:hypothetical protein
VLPPPRARIRRAVGALVAGLLLMGAVAACGDDDGGSVRDGGGSGTGSGSGSGSGTGSGSG